MKNMGYLGIDVSKGYADFLLLDQNKNVLEAGFMLQDTKEGRTQLGSLLKQWLSAGVTHIYCGVESTGGYENNWFSYLKQHQMEGKVQVCRINPSGIKSVSTATLTRTITDAVSAENIALYLMLFADKLIYEYPPGTSAFQEGRQYYTYVKMLIKQKVQLSNQLEKLLYQYFAEVMIYCRHGAPGWLLRMLAKYPGADAVKKAGVLKLSAIKGISKDKAAALTRKVQDSSQSVSPAVRHLIQVTCQEILHKKSGIATEKEYLKDLYQDDEKVQLLATIPGVGIESAILIMLEIETVDRFEEVKDITAYFGVHPTFRQSGDSVWENRLSKKGRPAIRGVLYMAAMSGLRYNPLLKQLYARFRAKGMKHKQAMGVVMHKLLRIIYGMLKSNTVFDKNIDENNTEKSADIRKAAQLRTATAKQEKKQQRNRYQSITTDAPTSRITDQRRKKQIASQSS